MHGDSDTAGLLGFEDATDGAEVRHLRVEAAYAVFLDLDPADRTRLLAFLTGFAPDVFLDAVHCAFPEPWAPAGGTLSPARVPSAGSIAL